MEVVEHVADPSAFVAELAARLAPGGLMILSTPNRTALSNLLLVEAAERVGAVPRGPHRSDERRVGKACVITFRSLWSPSHYNNNLFFSFFSSSFFLIYF